MTALDKGISDLADGLAALREARLDVVLGAMSDCVKIFDESARLIYINPRGLELMEAPDLATLNNSGHVSIPDEYLGQCIDIHARVIAGESVSWTYDLVGMKGGRHHVEARSVPLSVGASKVAHLCISRDAKERKRAEDALQRLRLIQEAIGLADFETDDDGIISPNGRFFEQIGLPPQDEPIKFEQWLEHVHVDDRQRLHEEVLRAMREEDRIECEFRVIRADTGETRWLATHTGVERNAAGAAVRTIGAHLDITDRKRAEEALRESETRLRAILDAMPDCVKIFDENAQLIYINPRGLELLQAQDLETLNASGHVAPCSLAACLSSVGLSEYNPRSRASVDGGTHMKTMAIAVVLACGMASFPAAAQDRFPGARIAITGGLDAARGTLTYTDSADPTNDFRESRSTTGVGYGATAGYDFRIGDGLYAGVEGSLDLADNKRCEVVLGNDAACFSVKRQWAIGARFGTRLAPRTMFFGGVAYVKGRARASYTDNADPTNNFAESDSRDGYRLSAGFEQQLWGNIFGSIEYRYSNYNDWTYTAGTESVSLTFQRHQALVGLGARF